jgi:hypothetical protein
MLARLKGATHDMYIQPVEPIGFEFSENIIAQVAPKEWILEKMGIDPTKYGMPTDPVEQQQAASVNEHLRGLKAGNGRTCKESSESSQRVKSPGIRPQQC